MFYQLHKRHGKHIAYDHDEVARNEKNGWVTVSEEEFYRKEKAQAARLSGKPEPKVDNAEVTEETASVDKVEAEVVPKKRGPKPKNQTVQ